MNVQNLAPSNARIDQLECLQMLVNLFGEEEVSGMANTSVCIGWNARGTQSYFRSTLDNGVRLEFTLTREGVEMSSYVTAENGRIYMVGNMGADYSEDMEDVFGGFYGNPNAQEAVKDMYGHGIL